MSATNNDSAGSSRDDTIINSVQLLSGNTSKISAKNVNGSTGTHARRNWNWKLVYHFIAIFGCLTTLSRRRRAPLEPSFSLQPANADAADHHFVPLGSEISSLAGADSVGFILATSFRASRLWFLFAIPDRPVLRRSNFLLLASAIPAVNSPALTPLNVPSGYLKPFWFYIPAVILISH
ncbi:hypothetical protein BV898_08863 [Hypsibius exemplaris]|uniref:Uncharacterized protein n=1 Tax=Hypsibius exemplaris TaxID=2072580 RepID=A0A1W0WP66_HYPEX|nr:hypothetical protein BV898_08863 [Hypsibius exemplaris]